MADRVDVAPGVLRWARERSGRSLSDLKRFPVAPWEAGTQQPTMRQLLDYAKATYTPVGFMFLREPPAPEPVPIPDFRTFGAKTEVLTPTPDLLETIYACQQRQDWYRDFAEDNGFDVVALVRSSSLATPVVEAAAQMRNELGFGLDRRVGYSTWADTLAGLRDHAEEAGVMVMISGTVGANTHRKLNPREFRGFALANPLAPVVFVNGADTKGAQIFTLAHELAHISLGESALSNAELGQLTTSDETEAWCNAVAAELLVPEVSLRGAFRSSEDLTDELERLAKFYRVSTLVVLRRVGDLGLLGPGTDFWALYRAEERRVMDLAAERNTTSGGSFYTTTPVRVSKRFARALISDTLEGRTSHREAYRLLGSRKHAAFEEISRGLGRRLMAYLIDSDVLIDAKNHHYGFDLVPGFWAWLERAHQAEMVYTVQQVVDEIMAGDDELSEWMAAQPNSFKLKPQASDTQALQQVAEWAVQAPYRQGAAEIFLAAGDYFLVAQALSLGYTVVTQEKPVPQSEKRIKIPDACNAAGVTWTSLFHMLKAEGARFDLA